MKPGIAGRDGLDLPAELAPATLLDHAAAGTRLDEVEPGKTIRRLHARPPPVQLAPRETASLSHADSPRR